MQDISIFVLPCNVFVVLLWELWWKRRLMDHSSRSWLLVQLNRNLAKIFESRVGADRSGGSVETARKSVLSTGDVVTRMWARFNEIQG